jgi:hypothetical protein
MSHLSHIPGAMTAAPLGTQADNDVKRALLALKDAAIRATAEQDVAFYANYLSDDAVGVTPFGVFDKQQILRGMEDGRSFRSRRIGDTRAVVLGEDAGLVTYRATFETADGETEFFVSTVYRRFADGWKGIFYQQTPLPKR